MLCLYSHNPYSWPIYPAPRPVPGFSKPPSRWVWTNGVGRSPKVAIRKKTGGLEGRNALLLLCGILQVPWNFARFRRAHVAYFVLLAPTSHPEPNAGSCETSETYGIGRMGRKGAKVRNPRKSELEDVMPPCRWCVGIHQFPLCPAARRCAHVPVVRSPRPYIPHPTNTARFETTEALGIGRRWK